MATMRGPPHAARDRALAGRAAVIGSGFGGLAAAIRLQSMGFETTCYEAHDKPGGRQRWGSCVSAPQPCMLSWRRATGMLLAVAGAEPGPR